ncbi:hypothetical protein RTBOTA2_005200 [Rhodotorula toruloides]|nr:hypothetical protein RTBOTA2_005200 [Rhodotorula toruloides]
MPLQACRAATCSASLLPLLITHRPSVRPFRLSSPSHDSSGLPYRDTASLAHGRRAGRLERRGVTLFNLDADMRALVCVYISSASSFSAARNFRVCRPRRLARSLPPEYRFPFLLTRSSAQTCRRSCNEAMYRRMRRTTSARREDARARPTSSHRASVSTAVAHKLSAPDSVMKWRCVASGIAGLCIKLVVQVAMQSSHRRDVVLCLRGLKISLHNQ